MTSKPVITRENLPDSIKGQVQQVQSATDDHSLALFIDNKDERLPQEKGGYELRAFSNSFNIYDLWGRFVRSGPKRLSIKEAPENTIVTRRIRESVDGFEYEGALSITPAVIKTAGSASKEMLIWPSDREEKVERALIRLASKGKIIKATSSTGIQYAVVFSMNELAQELKSVNQTMSYSQIKEALEALQGAKLTFKYTSVDTQNDDIDPLVFESNMNFLSSLHFSGRKGLGGEVKCVAVLNHFMHQMIDNLEYKGYYFNRAQNFSRSLTRWLMLRLFHLFRYAAPNKTHHFRLLSIMEKYGSIGMDDDISENRLKALRRDMTTTMKDLIEDGAIDKYEVSNIKDDNNQVIDYTYVIYPSERFCREMLSLNKHNKRIAIEGGKRSEEELIDLNLEF